MKRSKILSLILVLTMLIAAVSVINPTVLAVTKSDTASVGESTEQGYEELTSGDYKYIVKDDETAIITEYIGSNAIVVTPAEINGHPVIRIGVSAFRDSETLTDVTISEGVLTICNYAFAECNSLKTVNLPDSLNTIELNAFYECSSIESIYIPSGVHSIGSCAFESCTNLQDIQVTDNLFHIEYSAFSDTQWYYDQPEGMIYLGKVAYQYKGTAPKKVELRDGTLGIAGGAFFNQENLEEIAVPDSVFSIGYAAFLYTPWNDSLPDGGICVGKCFYTAKGDIENRELIIPEGVTGIGEGVLNYNSISSNVTTEKIDSVVIPDSVVNIDNRAFDRDLTLSSVQLGNSVKRIGNEAFIGCKNLKEVTIPASVEEIGDHAFGFSGSVAGAAGWWKYCDDFTIFGYVGTEGERYAKENFFNFIPLSEPSTEPETEIPTVIPSEPDTEPPADIPTQTPELYGDTDGNGIADVGDATYILRYDARIQIPISEDAMKKYGDVDNNGEVNTMDATYIQYYEAMLETPYPIGEPIA